MNVPTWCSDTMRILRQTRRVPASRRLMIGQQAGDSDARTRRASSTSCRDRLRVASLELRKLGGPPEPLGLREMSGRAGHDSANVRRVVRPADISDDGFTVVGVVGADVEKFTREGDDAAGFVSTEESTRCLR